MFNPKAPQYCTDFVVARGAAYSAVTAATGSALRAAR
jgi:hypothetical protein